TIPAAVPVALSLGHSPLTVHFSTEQSDGRWLVELRRHAGKATAPYIGGTAGRRYPLPGGASLTLESEYTRGRLWSAAVDTAGFASVPAFLRRYGQPIRYGYVSRPWPLAYYQTVFGIHPGSA